MDEFSIKYNKVLSMVKQGIPIYKAIKVLNISRWGFYTLISEEQKKELLLYKTINSKSSKYNNKNILND